MDCTVTVDTAEAELKLAVLEARLSWQAALADARRVADNWPSA